jgi:hypothetical protein
MNKLKRSICLMLVGSVIALSGCAGHTANPVALKQYGDTKMDCGELRVESQVTEARAMQLKRACDNKLPYNILMGVAGCFILVPWFAMDLKCGECEEYRAMDARADYLVGLANIECASEE